ncbi:MAG: hypothetical protein EAZ95_17930 [Bacteroidetes bacterium]|nr:MAG: hypothetical protein EAZ95_17930 [Bacteroidota bacterium]
MLSNLRLGNHLAKMYCCLCYWAGCFSKKSLPCLPALGSGLRLWVQPSCLFLSRIGQCNIYLSSIFALIA